jgi:hypothetical protein
MEANVQAITAMDLLKLFRRNSRDARDSQCLQCGLIPGREYMVSTSEPIVHPHECSWCKSLVYFPGLVMNCATCGGGTYPNNESAA